MAPRTRIGDPRGPLVHAASGWKREGWKLVATAAASFLIAVLGLNFVTPERHIGTAPARLYSIADPQFARVLGTLLGPPIVDGNRVTTLRNGDEIFPPMLAAIRAAEHSIEFETYVYWSGRIGQDFADAIAERARAGVAAHVLLDWVGSQRMDKRALDTMREAGAKVELYHPLRWYTLARLNNRTHRKLLVVDGRVAFTGGVGIAQEWTGNAQDTEHWRDTHFRIEGPVVAQMEAAFQDNWIKVTGDVQHGERYFPALAPAGDARAQMFLSSPSGGSESMELMYLLAIAAADTSIRLEAAYFIPDDLAIGALLAARARGVDIEIIVPGPHTDAEVTRYASRSTWGPLLEAGVRIYEYQPTVFHCKVLIVDERLTSVGSTNFDERSFRLNDEASLNVYDADFAREQARIFADDKRASKEYTFADWKERTWDERLGTWLAGRFQSQL